MPDQHQFPYASSSKPKEITPPVPTTGKGIKGFFSRSKATSPEPVELPISRSRLRSFIGDTSKIVTSSKQPVATTQRLTAASSARPSGDTTATRQQRTLSTEVTLGRQRLQRESDKDGRQRPVTPTERTQRQIRFNPTALPVMQKGEDGKWQPPSLSRGSLSTSALGSLQHDEEEGGTMTPTPKGLEDRAKKGHKHTLSGLFQSTQRHRSIIPQVLVKGLHDGGKNTVRASSMDRNVTNQATLKQPSPAPARNDDMRQPVSPPPTPLQSPLTARQPPTSNVKPTSRRPSLDMQQPPNTVVPPTPISPTQTPPTKSISPRHARRESASTSLLSKDHYLLRLSAAYIVRILTPVLRGSNFVGNEKNAEMKRIADDRISTLARMEKAWGADWARVGHALTSAENLISPADLPAVGSPEAKVRLVYVGDRARARERKSFIEALKDGILLCFTFNTILPSSPPHITKVNVTEDGVIKATNVTRFIVACQTIGVPAEDIFSPTDLQEGSEISLGRVASTIIALARFAGRDNAAIGRAKSPSSSRPGSRGNSRPPSRNATAATTKSPTRSPPMSPKPTSDDKLKMKRASREIANTSPPPPATSAAMERQGSNDSQNELVSKLQVLTDKKGMIDLDDPASWRTPTTSTFALPPEPPERPSVKRAAPPRSVTQPKISPIRPKSPTSSPSSRSITPVGRAGNLQIRPSLRPRTTTGSRVSVSFAENGLSSPGAENSDRLSSQHSPVLDQRHGHHHGSSSTHSRERTPSLISGGSRVTSAYSRSSVALSVATVIEADQSIAVDLTDDLEDEAMSSKLRERRMSEKKLQEARHKIIGTLLSGDDLPSDLRKAVHGATGVTTTGGMNTARDSALSDSLAALEGHRVFPSPSKSDSSPRMRPAARRGHSVEVNRVVEEEELNQSEFFSRPLANEGSRPSALRRLSSNGKVYVPKRSASPASALASPTETSFPVSPSMPNPPYMLRTTSLNSYYPMTESTENRRSDGYAYGLPGEGPYQPLHHQHRRDVTMSSVDSSRPIQMRVSSMINLPTSGMERSPTLQRETSSQSVTRSSQALQVLEFHEPGCPAVKYQLGNCIGKGQFGSVYRSLNLSTGQMVAIKRIRLHGMREDEVTDVMHEVELLKRLSHPSIVKYEGMSRDEEYLNIVLEFVENGSLGQTLKAFGNFNERLVSSYVAKILEGLDYLHSQGVVHCDLKAANILSTKNGNVKLSDFGVSLNMKAVENIKQDALTAGKGGAKKRVSEVAGTPNWMAPEVISLAGASFASDIWSLGCTIIELLTGKPPYSDVGNSMSVLFRIVEDDLPPLPSGISDDLTDFLRLCFIKDPKARPAAVVMFEHPWLKALNPELALRPQDSVPFLRRVSTDLRRDDSTRLFDNEGVADGRRHRHSFASSHGRDGSGGAGPDKGHVLIKTSFGKAIACRVCLIDVKKVGVLCQDCGLIAHTACASKASPRCDTHEQLALFAKQQEILNPDGVHGPSRVASPQPSFDGRESHLTALPGKILNGFKRSKSKGGLSTSMSMGASQSQLNLNTHIDTRRPPRTNQAQAYIHNQDQLYPRPSLETNPSSRSTNYQNRASAYSNLSEYGYDPTQEAKRRSGVTFELGDQPSPGPMIGGSGNVATVVGDHNMKEDMASAQVTAQDLLNAETKYTHTKGKDSKSDCCIM